jgi:soluble lytic murein transglycosylase-like protein
VRVALALAALVAAPLAAVAAVNVSVRLLGGDVAPLSLDRWSARARALGALARHLPGHFGASCGDPRAAQLEAAAARHRVPLELLRAVARVESSLRPHRVSAAGAMGVMQLMPATAAELGVEDPFDARASVEAGAAYLARLDRRYRGDRARVAAAYNAGPGHVPRAGPLPAFPETRRYVRKVIGGAGGVARGPGRPGRDEVRATPPREVR